MIDCFIQHVNNRGNSDDLARPRILRRRNCVAGKSWDLCLLLTWTFSKVPFLYTKLASEVSSFDSSTLNLDYLSLDLFRLLLAGHFGA